MEVKMADPIEPETEPEEPETEPEEPETEKPGDDLEAKIEAVVDRLLPKFLKGKGGVTGARKSYRDEEDTMAELVASKVQELLGLEKKAGEHHPEPGEKKADPEPVPASPIGRRVERIMGW
jgi:hypothetical protein